MPRDTSKKQLVAQARTSQVPAVASAAGLNHQVRKHVATIHTSGELGLVERKLVNVLLLNAYDRLKAAKEQGVPAGQHRIPTKLLMAMIGWTASEDTVHLRKSLLKIVSTPVEFDLLDGGKNLSRSKRWTATTLLAQGDIEDGFCDYEYSTRMADELADPDVYAIIDVGIQDEFRGGYAFILYENCVRYRNVGSTGFISLDLLRKVLGATAATYDDFRRLSELILKKAIVEVNQVSDIHLTPEYQRQGRKVVGIRFIVEEQPQQQMFSDAGGRPDSEIRETETFKRLRSHGIGEKLALAFVKTDEERAKAALDLTEQRARAKQIRSSTGGYVRRLIEDATIDLTQSAFEKQLVSERQQQKADEMRAAAEQKDAQQLADQRAEKITAVIKALPDAQAKAFAAEYVRQAQEWQTKSYNPSTGKFSTAVERVAYTTWLRQKIADVHAL